MPFSDLHEDIINVIVDCIDDKAFLSSLSVISTVFRETCQRRLFQEISLICAHPEGYPQTKRIHAFHHILTSNPRIPLYVRRLTVMIPPNKPYPRPEYQIVNTVLEYLVDSPIHTLTMIETPKLGWVELCAWMSDWRNQSIDNPNVSPSDARRMDLELELGSYPALFRLFDNPNIEHLAFPRCIFPEAFFSRFRELLSVSLVQPQVSTSTIEVAGELVERIPCKVTAFDIVLGEDHLANSFDVVSTLRIDFTGLETLSITFNSACLGGMAHFLQVQSVTSLTLIAKDSISTPPPNIDLSSLPKLSTLTFHSVFGTDDNLSLDWVHQALLPLTEPQHNRIRNLTLKLLVRNYDTLRSSARRTEHRRPLPIVKVLENLHKNSRVEEINMELAYVTGSRTLAMQVVAGMAIVKRLFVWEGSERVVRFVS